jgi:hypothetical protein
MDHCWQALTGSTHSPLLQIKNIAVVPLGMNPRKYKKLIDEVVGDEEYMPTDQVLCLARVGDLAV